MAWQQSDLDAVDDAIKSNVRSVTYADGRKVEYQDIDKMLAVRTVIRDELASATAKAGGRLRTTRAVMCRR